MSRHVPLEPGETRELATFTITRTLDGAFTVSWAVGRDREPYSVSWPAFANTEEHAIRANAPLRPYGTLIQHAAWTLSDVEAFYRELDDHAHDHDLRQQRSGVPDAWVRRWLGLDTIPRGDRITGAFSLR